MSERGFCISLSNRYIPCWVKNTPFLLGYVYTVRETRETVLLEYLPYEYAVTDCNRFMCYSTSTNDALDIYDYPKDPSQASYSWIEVSNSFYTYLDHVISVIGLYTSLGESVVSIATFGIPSREFPRSHTR